MSGNGRLTEASIAAVRERANIEEVVSVYVQLKRAGGGSLNGLCPFHDEKGPSFHVTPARGFYHCFGCQAGGDVIKFIQEIEGLDFIAAIEHLAERFSVDLAYEEAAPGAATRSREDREASRQQRTRLVEAHKIATAFYTSQLLTPDAAPARTFLDQRGFDRAAADQFGCGYAPDSWNALISHLGDHGYTPEEALTAGLASQNASGRIYDRFRGRLMWPIADTTGTVIGFGARKLLDTDEGPKYLNTPETPIYKKSQVLYGLNTARKDIARTGRAVVVEGYTDVMACHLAGVTQAVATCGTAFGEDHVRIIRRLLGDDSTGEVIYTFDGDAAGQKAALRAFAMDDHFQTHTTVAVAANGMDPCELRLAHGNQAILDLVEERTPLFGFAIRATLADYNLNTPEGRINGLAATAPILATIKTPALADEYVRRLATVLQQDQHVIRQAVQAAPPLRDGNPFDPPRPTTPRSPAPAAPAEPGTDPDHEPPPDDDTPTPDPASPPGDPAPGPAPDGPPRPDPAAHPEQRTVLKIMLADPTTVALARAENRASHFTDPGYRATWDALIAADNDPAKNTTQWVHTVQAHASHDSTRALITELAVEPLPTGTNLATASSAFLTLACRAIERRLRYVGQATAHPDIAEADLLKYLAEISPLQARLAETQTRLRTLDYLHTPSPGQT